MNNTLEKMRQIGGGLYITVFMATCSWSFIMVLETVRLHLK